MISTVVLLCAPLSKQYKSASFQMILILSYDHIQIIAAITHAKILKMATFFIFY